MLLKGIEVWAVEKSSYPLLLNNNGNILKAFNVNTVEPNGT